MSTTLTRTAAPTTLGTLLPLAASHLWGGTKGEATSVGNARDVVATLGPDMPLEHAASHLTVAALKSTLAQRGLAPATVNKKLGAFSAMLRFAQDLDAVREVPVIKRSRVPAGRTRFLSPAEEAAFLELIPDQTVRSLCVFLVETGLRRGEALALEWRDIEDDGAVVAVRESKNGKARRVPLTLRAQRVLQDRRAYARPFGIKPARLTHYWNIARGLYSGDTSDLVPHILRHTCASRLVQRGVHLKVVQQWMGHSSIETTLRYAHVRDEDLLSAARALEGPQS